MKGKKGYAWWGQGAHGGRHVVSRLSTNRQRSAVRGLQCPIPRLQHVLTLKYFLPETWDDSECTCPMSPSSKYLV